MTFFEAIQTVFRKFADFTGSAGRREFWWFALFSVIVSSALGALNISTPDGRITIGSSLAAMWAVVILVPTLAVSVRRLRDAGHRWTQLLWILLPIAGLIVLIVRYCEPGLAREADAPIPAAA